MMKTNEVLNVELSAWETKLKPTYQIVYFDATYTSKNIKQNVSIKIKGSNNNSRLDKVMLII